MKRACVVTICLPILAAMSTGCGNMLKANVPHALESSYMTDAATASPGTGTGTTDPNYSCPASPNILPDYDYWHDGTGQYTVCMNVNNQTDLLIHGIIPKGGNQICVLPAQVIDAQHIYAKPDLTSGLPIMQCVDVTTQGAYTSFPSGVNYNAVFVVAGVDGKQMQNCLFGGNYYSCPQYSFGRFR